MKTTGAILTVGGFILAAVGVNGLNRSTPRTTNSYGSPQTTYSGNPEGSAAAFLLGTAGLGAGIPLWIVGAHAERKYNRKLENIQVGFNFNPQKTGLTFTYRFP